MSKRVAEKESASSPSSSKQARSELDSSQDEKLDLAYLKNVLMEPDIIFIVGGQRFPAHKSVMMDFQRIFRVSELKGVSQGESEN